MHVGFIGLGRMGFPMAHNLIKAGHTVVAHNRSRGPVERLAELGAIPASSPAEVARSVEILVSCLLTSLDEINQAMSVACSGKAIRVAVLP